MRAETVCAFALAAMFGTGIVLLLVGLGVSTKLAAFVVGLVLCGAAISLVKSGGRL